MAAVRRAWHEAGRHEAALVAGIVLLLAGLAFGRADVALLGLPAMLGAVFARTRPAPAPLLVGEQPHHRPLDREAGLRAAVLGQHADHLHRDDRCPG